MSLFRLLRSEWGSNLPPDCFTNIMFTIYLKLNSHNASSIPSFSLPTLDPQFHPTFPQPPVTCRVVCGVHKTQYRFLLIANHLYSAVQCSVYSYK
jgi:hypothetical protein